MIAQTIVQNKTNEIPTLPVLLEPLDIKGRVVTADAMHTQVATNRNRLWPDQFISETSQSRTTASIVQRSLGYRK